jgi:hypothetical protein
MAMFFGYREQGQFTDRTGSHLLGGGAHHSTRYLWIGECRSALREP